MFETTQNPQFLDNLTNEHENDHLLTNGSSEQFKDNFNYIFFQDESFGNSSKDEFQNIPINNLYLVDNFKKEEDKTKNLKYEFQVDSKLIIKKRGRYKVNDKSIKVHDKFSRDNILRKIQVHYISFLLSFMNTVLKTFGYTHKFLQLNYDFKKNVNKTFIDSLKTKTIRDIICNKISQKYKTHDEDINMRIYEQIKENKVINNILSENYLRFFKKFYYKSNKVINLQEYGLDSTIILSKNVKMYKDLIDSCRDTSYLKRMNECVTCNFLPDSIFLLQ